MKDKHSERPEEKKSDVARLLEYLLGGSRIMCKDAYRLLRIPDLRSRLSDLKRMGYTVERERVPNKAYKVYYFKNPKSLR